MGFDKRKVDYYGQYPSLYVLKYFPFIGSIIITGFWTFSYINDLVNQAILMDSMLPIIEASRIENLLIWMSLTTLFWILTYFILIPISQKYHDSHTISSECSDLFESAKSKMGIDFRVDLRVNREKGIVLASFRDPFNASVVISSSTQRLFLQEKKLGEAIIAHELGLMKNYRPWGLIGAVWAISLFIALSLVPKPTLLDSPGLFEFLLTNSIGAFPFILFLLGMFLSNYTRGTRFDPELSVSKEYQVSPLLARMALLEGYTIRRSDIEIRTDMDNNLE